MRHRRWRCGQASHGLQLRRIFDDVFSIQWRRAAATIALVVCLLARRPLRRNAALYSPPELSTVRAVPAEHGMVVAQEKTRRAGRRRYPETGRQCGRCRGRHRLCAGRDLSARRQYRRRRLHGDPFRRAQRRRRDRLSRDRAGGDHARHVSRRRTASPTPTSRAIPRSASACPAPSPDWRWRWKNTAPANFTLAQILKPAIELARDGFVVADDMADTLPDMYRRMARWPNSAKTFSRADGTPSAGRRPAGPDRSRGNAVGDRRAGTARILRRAGRRKTGKGGQRCRRHHDGGRSEIVSGRDPRAGARQLSRLRHRLDAAALVRRHGAAGDAEHPRRVSDVRHEAGLRALAACHDRGDEARLCRPRALSRRSRLRQRAGQCPDHQGLRRQAARQHRSRRARRRRPTRCR